MSLNWNKESNTLVIKKDIEKVVLKGFMLQVANSEEDVRLIQEGLLNSVNLSPVLAPNQEAAIEVVKSQGKIPLSINPLEFLELQVKLIKDLAKEQNIELENSMTFNLEFDKTNKV